MNIALTSVRAEYADWSLSADGTFGKGLHLVSGDVGSGKSTLALLLAGLIPPASGTVEREGISSLMVAFQYPEFHITGSTVEKECATWGLDHTAVLEAAGLAGKNDTDPLTLSRGELKRLVLSCVMAGDYDLLILDEPFSSLDCPQKEQLCTTLTTQSRGITILLTHEQTIFPRVDRIWEIKKGRLLDLGRPPAALGQWEHAPAIIKSLVAQKKVPANISQADLLEAACRT